MTCYVRSLLLSCKAEDTDEQPEPEQPPAQQSESAKKRTAADKDIADAAANEAAAAAAEECSLAKRPKFSKLGKDPTVSTNFLPDKDRELQEEELRQQLKKVSGGMTVHWYPTCAARRSIATAMLHQQTICWCTCCIIVDYQQLHKATDSVLQLHC